MILGDAGLPGIDAKAGLAVMGGNASLYARMLKKFADSPYYDELTAAIERGNVEEIRAGAHTLKGVAANLSLQPLKDLVTEIEQEAKNGAAVASGDPRLAALEQAYRDARASALLAAEDPEKLKG